MSGLTKTLGTLQLVALGAAGVVGTSWIYTNGDFFSKYGAGGEIFGLAIAAVFVSFVAIAYGELASKLPRAGGEVVYGYTAYNRPVAFVAGWFLLGAFVSSLAFYVTSFGLLLADVAPWMHDIPLYTINDVTVYLPVLIVGIALTLVVFGLNWFGASLSASIQIVLFSVMVLLGLTLIVVGFTHGSPDNFWPPYESDTPAVSSTIRFILPGLTFLTGFSLVAILAEDAKASARRIGRAVVLSVIIAASFYCLVLLASAWVIPWTETAGLEKGTIDAFRRAGYDVLGWGAYVIALLGLLTSFVGLFMASSRIVLAMGRVGLLPGSLSRLTGSRQIPRHSLVFVLIITLGLGWLGTGAITWFLDTGGVFVGCAWAIGVLCFYRLTRRYPHLRGEYRVRQRWLPALGAIAGLFVIGFSLWPGTSVSLQWPAEYVILLVWLVLGAILYAVTRGHDDDRARRELLGPLYDELTPAQGSEPAYRR